MNKIKRQKESEDEGNLALVDLDNDVVSVPDVGEHWNHLTRLASKFTDRYRLECDCGNIIDLPIKFVEARGMDLRQLQTCGQKTCHIHGEIKKREGKQPKDGEEEIRRRGRPRGEGGDCVRSSHYMPQQLVAALYGLAKKTNRSYNAVLTECVR